MKTLPRTQLGNPILRQKAKKIPLGFLKTTEFKNLTKQMFITMRRAGGIGLAAPQIGRPLKLAVIEVRKTRFRPNAETLSKTVIINPRILSCSRRQADDWEGCLSFMSVRGKTPRFDAIKVEYISESGEKIIRKLKGFLARVFQHEIDHLNGMVYLDRMKDMKTLMTWEEFKKRIPK